MLSESSPPAASRRALKVMFVAGCLIFGVMWAQHLTHAQPPGVDEGDMLSMFLQFSSGLHPYTELTAPYGPFFFLVQSNMFHLLHLPVTHDAGREIMQILWITCSVLGGMFTYRRTANIWLSCAAGLALEMLEVICIREPGHPQQIILVLLMLGCYASTLRSIAGPLLLGFAGAAICFTKINIGVFFFAALAMTLVCGMPRGMLRKMAGALMFLYALLVPLALMHRHASSWALELMCLATITACVTFAVSFDTTNNFRS